MTTPVGDPRSGSASTAVLPAANSPLRAALAGFVGTTLEWYDYFLYGSVAALVFPKLYFADLGPTVGTLVSLATFSVAFVLRPVGGIIFGHYGDRLGRKRMLIITLAMMGGATFLIGLLPTRDQIGVLAPALLIVLRMVQGIALGGEWGGAALVTVENAPAHQRGRYGVSMQLGAPGGQLLSSGLLGLFALLPDEQFFSWGWRVPFLLSAVLLLVGVYVRFGLAETPNFQRLQDTGARSRVPLVELFRTAARPTTLLTFVQSGPNIAYYLFTVYSAVYITEKLGLPRSWALIGVLIAASVEILTMPLFAILSDRIGRRPVYAFSTVFLAAYAFPFFWLADTRQQLWIWVALAIGLGIGHSAACALHGPLYAEQFPTRIRYTGAGFAYQACSTISAAPAAVVATALINATGSSAAVSLYVIGGCLVSLVCVLLLRETYRSDISG
ncbi:MHS family MFS transporter [Saccharopolyspora sp. K220]|uniref:MFS transporter n=1 Tax=Saccharopolyspora soli TaxID=2926618 RepID=UPI001F5ACED7|nr:MFS transporter [Saccharopolyspora soli]MCI2418288.1 MHS family MFS transporter [Saccharopolyspora soli]